MTAGKIRRNERKFFVRVRIKIANRNFSKELEEFSDYESRRIREPTVPIEGIKSEK